MRHFQRRWRGHVGVAHRQRMEVQHVEVRRVGAAGGTRCAVGGEAQQRAQELHGRHPPDAGGVAVGSQARRHHRVAGLDRLHGGVEAVEQFPVDDRREGAPAPFLRHPLGLQVAREVGLVPGLEQAHPRERVGRAEWIGEASVVAEGERGGERAERLRAGVPAARVGVGPARLGFGEGRARGRRPAGASAPLPRRCARRRRSARSGRRGSRGRRRRTPVRVRRSPFRASPPGCARCAPPLRGCG